MRNGIAIQLALILNWFFLPPLALAAEPIRVGIYQNEPKIFVDDEGVPAGFFVTLLEQIAAQEEWQLEYLPCQWKSCLRMLEQGGIHLMPDEAYSAQRSGRFAFGREVVLSSWSEFYTRPGRNLFSIKALDGKKVAVLKFSIQYRAFRQRAQELGIRPDYVETDRFDEIFRLIESGQVDAGLVNTFYGRKAADDHRVVRSKVLIEPSQLGFAATKGRAAELLPTIDKYLSIWKQETDSPYFHARQQWLAPLEETHARRRLHWIIAATVALTLVLGMLALIFRAMVNNRTRELAEKRAHLDHLAHHDPLTGLPNRLLFFDRLKQSMRHSQRHNDVLALLFLDLDQFKQINDSFGHAVGDEVLKVVAKRLRKTIREEDTVARIGGDEFSIIMQGLHNPADVIAAARHLANAFARPFRVPGHRFTITLSIGISLYPQDGNDAQTLLRNADTAMFKAKAEGRNTFALYTEEMTHQAVERSVMEQDLRHALENHALDVHYQPQVRLADRKLIGFEALARWNHPEQGMTPPRLFIPLAEETGLISQLGEQVLRTACRQLADWREKGLDPGLMAVNISAKQLREAALLPSVSRIIEETACRPFWVELEVTESFVMHRPQESITTMARLRKLGIELAIDDFGTGYSSLAYLKKLPISKLKIDRSFVAGVCHDDNDLAICRAIIALGKALGLRVIAEGVETAEQDALLRAEGCDEAQGFYYGKPLPAEEMENLLRETQGAGLV